MINRLMKIVAIKCSSLLHAIPSVTPFVINCNKTHKSQLKYEIKYDLYKISPKHKKTKFWTFGVFKVVKNPFF